MDEQVIKDLIQEAWCEGDTNAKDKFGDFLNRAALKITEQARQERKALLETIEDMYPELKQVYWEGKNWQALKREQLDIPERI